MLLSLAMGSKQWSSFVGLFTIDSEQADETAFVLYVDASSGAWFDKNYRRHHPHMS